VVGVFAGPMLAVFLLGIFTRRATAAAALSGLALGAAAALVAALGHLAGQLWPMPGPLGAFWPFLIGLAVALVVGYALSFVVGRKKTRDELTGLVVGVGRLGEVPEPKPGGQDVLWLPSDDEQDDQAESPWAFPV
jgi:Na+/proline symporter